MELIIIVVLLFGIEVLYINLATRFGIVDKPNERSMHAQLVLRGGGIIFTPAFLMFLAANSILEISTIGNYLAFGIGVNKLIRMATRAQMTTLINGISDGGKTQASEMRTLLTTLMNECFKLYEVKELDINLTTTPSFITHNFDSSGRGTSDSFSG